MSRVTAVRVTAVGVTAVRVTAGMIAAICFALLPGQALGQGQVQTAVEKTIVDTYAHATEHLVDQPGGYSMHGAVEFWSSGGLKQMVPTDSPTLEYDSLNLVPKHIEVIVLADGAAVAQFYVEGSFQEKGRAPVDHYMTRATQVFVEEGGTWMVRAAHWSPIAAGSGTQQTAIIKE